MARQEPYTGCMRVTIVASTFALLVAGCGDTGLSPDAAADLTTVVGDLSKPPVDLASADLTPPPDLTNPNLDLKPGPDMAPARFQPQTSGTTDFLTAVFGFGMEVYVAGGAADVNGKTIRTTILHTKDGGAHWTPETSPSTFFPYGIWGSAATDVYIVGEAGTILHSTGNGTWTAVSSGVTTVLSDVWGSGAADIYAVGEAGKILHSLNGTLWTAQTSGTTNTLFGTWASGANDVYAVGDKGTILHSGNAGVTWTAQTSGSGLSLLSVSGTGAGNVYVVGDQGLVLHSTGNGSWAGQTSNVTTFLGSVTSTGPDIWVVGSMATIIESDPGVMSGAFEKVSSAQPTDYNGVWGSSASNVFIVGANGTILH